MVKTQIELEEENLQIMIDKATLDFNKATENGSLSDFKMSGKIIPWYVGELADKLDQYKYEILAGKAKRKAVPAKVLSVLDPVVVAHYVVTGVINTFGTKRPTITSIGSFIAKTLDTEYRLIKLEDKDKTSKNNLVKFVQGTSYKGARQMTVARDMITKYHTDVMKDKEVNFMKLAILAINVLAECQPIINNQIMPPLINIGLTKDYKDFRNIVVPLPWFSEWILNKIEKGELISSVHTAMIEPPIPWEGIKGGGFHTDRFKYNLIRTKVDSEEYYGVDMSNTLNAVNKLQRTKWTINKRVLEVMQHTRDNNLRWGDLPYNKEVKKSVYPFPDRVVKDLNESEKVILKNWRIASTQEYNEKASEDSKFMALVRVLGDANRFKDYSDLYFSYFLDFRGRAYPVSSNLHPQGTDYIKSLLMFSEGKAIDTIDAEMFLAMQGANSFGIDKETFINKHKWVLENEYRILKCADNPYHPSAMWKECGEDAWLFLAFCFEWADYRKYGSAFKSHLPVAMDGSCNGLQHLSAILFDEVGGKSVNITNNTLKCDIYSDVKDVAEILLKKSDDPLAEKILQFGLTRKAVKRPVMIVPYAGTIRACRKYIDEEITSKGARSHFGEDYSEALTLYSDMVWEAIGEVVVKGREVMSFLSDTARLIIKETKSTNISWTTPNGFKVIQRRVKEKQLRIETPLGNLVNSKTMRTMLHVDTDKTSSAKHATGIAPNFVHSLDSCHLQNTTNLMDEDCSLAMIHDSYGTHASDSRQLFNAIRSTFYDMYKNGIVLDTFLKQQPDIDIEDKPTIGSLDLSKVLDSEHFFS